MKVAFHARVSKTVLEQANAHGKRLGRPRKHVNMARSHELRALGSGYRKVANELCGSCVAVRWRLREEGVEPPNETVSGSKA